MKKNNIIGILAILVLMHSYIAINFNELKLFQNLVGSIMFPASFFGSMIGTLALAFIPASILSLAVYRKDIKNHKKDFVFGWIIISIVITYFVIEGYNVKHNVNEGNESQIDTKR